MRTVVTEKGSVQYLNSGDWIENLTALEYYNKCWHLYQHDHKAATVPTAKKQKPVLNVVSEEVMLHVHSLETRLAG
jgi:hypothetical protein